MVIIVNKKAKREDKRRTFNIWIYDKKENEGKCKKSAKIAGVNKLLKIYYGMIKRVYKEEIEVRRKVV